MRPGRPAHPLTLPCTMTNPHELRARDRKASAISAHLMQNMDEPDDGRHLSEVVAEMDEAQREIAAAAAGQKSPSDKTWARVVRKLELEEEDVFARFDDDW